MLDGQFHRICLCEGDWFKRLLRACLEGMRPLLNRGLRLKQRIANVRLQALADSLHRRPLLRIVIPAFLPVMEVRAQGAAAGGAVGITHMRFKYSCS